jgi:hypothetical protein
MQDATRPSHAGAMPRSSKRRRQKTAEKDAAAASSANLSPRSPATLTRSGAHGASSRRRRDIPDEPSLPARQPDARERRRIPQSCGSRPSASLRVSATMAQTLGPVLREVVALVEEQPRARPAELQLQGRLDRLEHGVKAGGARRHALDTVRGDEQHAGPVGAEVPERHRTTCRAVAQRACRHGTHPREGRRQGAGRLQPWCPARLPATRSSDSPGRVGEEPFFAVPSGRDRAPVVRAARRDRRTRNLDAPCSQAAAIASIDSVLRSRKASVSVERCQLAPSGHTEEALTSPAFPEGPTAPRSASRAALFSRMHSPPASTKPFTARSAWSV